MKSKSQMIEEMKKKIASGQDPKAAFSASYSGGGMVDEEDDDSDASVMNASGGLDDRADQYADGGEVDKSDEQTAGSMLASSGSQEAREAAQRGVLGYAKGGMVDDDDSNTEDEVRPMGVIQAEGMYQPAKVMNPSMQEASRMLARKLFAKSQDDDMMYAMGGLVQGDKDTDVGNKPGASLSGPTSEPMSSMPMKPSADRMLSAAAMEALMLKKKNRKFSQ